MSFLASRTKKIIALMIAASTMTIFVSPSLRAQGLDVALILAAIKKDTGEILHAVDSIPSQLNTIIEAVVALNVTWTQPDSTDTSANLQSSFATMTDTVIKNSALQTSIQSKLLNDFLQPTASAAMPNYVTPPTAVTAQNFPFANDMTFQTLLGQPYFAKDPRPTTDANKNQIVVDPTYNYIKNAAGLNITHVIPGQYWSGSQEARQKYFNFYTTINAIQTYDAYILGQLYSDFANGPQLTNQQNALMKQASNSDWFSQVATENIGVVLRQILMYNSQTFVLLTQLLQTQRQALAAQAMTNTLIVLGNQFNERSLLNDATKGS
jgi:hypothetical protein